MHDWGGVLDCMLGITQIQQSLLVASFAFWWFGLVLLNGKLGAMIIRHFNI